MLDQIARNQGIGVADIEVWSGDEAAPARRTRSPGVRPGEAHAPRHRRTNAQHPPTSSAQSVPRRGPPPVWPPPVCAALVQHRSHGPAPGGDRGQDHAGQTRRSAGRSGWVVHIRATGRATQHHHRAATCQMPRAEPDGKVRQFKRDNWLSDRISRSYDAIVDHCCYAWTNSSINPGASCPST